jgi:hypothetical protein
MNFIRTLPLLGVLFLSPAKSPAQEAAESPLDLVIGGRHLVVPLPEGGFVRCDGIDPAWDKTIAATLPATNRLLASFGTRENRQGIRDGRKIDFSRNFNIQTLRSEESRELGTKAFAEIRADIRKEIENMKATLDAHLEKLAADGNRNLSRDLGIDAALEFSEAAVLGSFEDGDSALGFTLAMKVGSYAEGVPGKLPSVVAALILPVNGRLLMLYSTSSYTGESDRLEVERSVKAWGAAIAAANPKVEGPGIFGASTLSVLVGAILGIALALYLLLKRTHRPPA